MEQKHPPGWYQHPTGDVRWWDGGAWHKPGPPATAGSAAAAAMPAKKDNTLKWVLGLVGAVLVGLVCCGGALLMWSATPTGDDGGSTSQAYDEGYAFGESINHVDNAEGNEAACEHAATLGDSGTDGYTEGTDEYDDFVEGCLAAL